MPAVLLELSPPELDHIHLSQHITQSALAGDAEALLQSIVTDTNTTHTDEGREAGITDVIQGLADAYESDPGSTVSTLAQLLQAVDTEEHAELMAHTTMAALLTGGKLLMCAYLQHQLLGGLTPGNATSVSINSRA
jgi:hypothetical protein